MIVIIRIVIIITGLLLIIIMAQPEARRRRPGLRVRRGALGRPPPARESFGAAKMDSEKMRTPGPGLWQW
eukprot:2803176-Rhodomonas_salina.1